MSLVSSSNAATRFSILHAVYSECSPRSPFIHSSQINLIIMEDNTTNFRAPHRRVDHTYNDYSLFPLDRLPKDKKGSTNFPAKLHRILSNPEYSHVRHSLQTSIVGPILRRSILHLIPINALIHLFLFLLDLLNPPPKYYLLNPPIFFSDHIMDGKKIDFMILVVF